MKITAAVVRERSGPFAIEELELEEPRDNEVLVRIVAVGMCHTDLAMRNGQGRFRSSSATRERASWSA